MIVVIPVVRSGYVVIKMIDGDVGARLVSGVNQGQLSFIFAERVFLYAAMILSVHVSPSRLIIRIFYALPCRLP